MTNADQANALKQSGWSFLIFKLRPLHPCSWLKLSQQWTGNNTYAIDPCQKMKTPANQTKPGWDSGVCGMPIFRRAICSYSRMPDRGSTYPTSTASA